MPAVLEKHPPPQEPSWFSLLSQCLTELQWDRPMSTLNTEHGSGTYPGVLPYSVINSWCDNNNIKEKNHVISLVRIAEEARVELQVNKLKEELKHNASKSKRSR